MSQGMQEMSWECAGAPLALRSFVYAGFTALVPDLAAAGSLQRGLKCCPEGGDGAMTEGSGLESVEVEDRIMCLKGGSTPELLLSSKCCSHKTYCKEHTHLLATGSMMVCSSVRKKKKPISEMPCLEPQPQASIEGTVAPFCLRRLSQPQGIF